MAKGELDTDTKYMAQGELDTDTKYMAQGELDTDTKYMAYGKLTYTKYMAWHRANLIHTLNIWHGIGRT